MELTSSDNSKVNTDAEIDAVLLQSACTPLLPVLRHLESTCEDKNRSFAEKRDVLVSAWHNIVEFILREPSHELNVDVFEYVYPVTIRVLLDSAWLTVDATVRSELRVIFERCLTYFERFNSLSMVTNVGSLIKLVDAPWDDPFFKCIFNDCNFSDLKREDLTEYFESENLLLISTRIKVLIKSKSEDLGLRLVNAVVKYTGILPASWIDVYIRVMTKSINKIERFKANDEPDRLKYAEISLSHVLVLLADVMKEQLAISRELVLTAFSLNPTKNIFALVKRVQRKYVKEYPDVSYNFRAISPETGKILVESPNYNPLFVTSDMVQECESVGMNEDATRDLVSIIANQRFRKLSWMHDWKKLKFDCNDYLKHWKEMRHYDKELKYLKIDYSQFE